MWFVLEKVNVIIENLVEICINEVILVIGDVVMEIIIEIIIIEFIMIGYNFKILGGFGMGLGVMVLLDDVIFKLKDEDYIVIILKIVDFEDVVK